jgi:hypothetical protein
MVETGANAGESLRSPFVAVMSLDFAELSAT